MGLGTKHVKQLKKNTKCLTFALKMSENKYNMQQSMQNYGITHFCQTSLAWESCVRR